MQNFQWSGQFRLSVTVVALVVFFVGAAAGGLAGFVLLGLPAILLLAICWAGPIAGAAAGWISKSTVESWEQRKKSDLREIEALMRSRNYEPAAQRLEAIITKEPHHTEALLLAVSLYRAQGQNQKAQQLCLELVNRKDAPLSTTQALMAQVGMTEQEIRQASATREREERRERLIEEMERKPDDHWIKIRLIDLLITEFGDDAQAGKMIEDLARQPGAPLKAIEQMRIKLARKNLPESSTIKEARIEERSEPPACPSQDPEIKKLLAANSVGSAVSRLEAGLQQWPDDFEGWMLLAQVYSERCYSAKSAERAVSSIRLNPRFTPEQKAQAETRLRELNRKNL